MRQYRVKGSDSLPSYVWILGEEDGGYRILMVRMRGDYLRKREEFLSREAFDMCLRTGYLEAVEEPQEALISA